MDYFLFFVICVAATFSPGPAVMLAIKNAASFGIHRALYGIAGNLAAMITMASLSAAGLGALIATSESAFMLIKTVGGIYLVYLGIKTWCTHSSFMHNQTRILGTVKRRKLFFEAYLVGATNPKAIAFYSALFPQFIDVSHPVFGQFLLLTFIFAALSFSALFSYALLANRLKALLTRNKVKQVFNKLTGGVFIGFGVSLLVSQRG